MSVRCHLDKNRVCDSSCIAFDYHLGCRVKANFYAPKGRVSSAAEEDILKEI